MVNKMNKRRARMRHLAATILLSCHFCSSYIPAKILSAPQRSHHRSTASPSTSHLARKRTIRQRDGFEFLDSIVLLAVKLNEEKVVNETSSGVYFADTENSGGREVVMLKPKLNGVAKKSSDMNGKTNSFAVRETENDSNTNGSKVSLDKETEPENDSTIGSIFYRKYRGIKASNPNQGSIKKFGLGEVVVNGDHAEGSDGENRRTSRFGKAWSPLKKIYTQVKRLKPGSTEGSSESSSTHRIWRRRHARTLEEGIRRETSEGQSELPERKAQLSSLLDRAQIDARKSHHRRYVERTLMGLINALAQEIEDLDVDINSNPDTPIWRKELKELRISFSRMGFKPLQMGGSNMARFQTETDYAEESEQQLPLVECADEAFDRLDVDGSGTLDREEIAQALSMISGLQTDKESINDLAAELVDLYDEDKNGVVDREEYQQMVEDMAALQAKNKDENGPLNAMKKSVQSISQGISKKAAQVAAAAKRSSSSDDDFDDFDELEMGSITMSNINLDLRQLLFGNLPFIKKITPGGPLILEPFTATLTGSFSREDVMGSFLLDRGLRLLVARALRVRLRSFRDVVDGAYFFGRKWKIKSKAAPVVEVLGLSNIEFDKRDKMIITGRARIRTGPDAPVVTNTFKVRTKIGTTNKGQNIRLVEPELALVFECPEQIENGIGVICENLGIPRPKRPEPYYSFFPIYSKFEVNENAGFNMGDDNCLRKIFIKNGKLRFEMRAVLRPGRFLGNHYLAFTVPMRTFIITMDRIRQGARAARENKKVAAREKKLLTQLSEEYIARPANEQRTTSKEANSTEESDNEPLNRRLFSFLWNKRPPMPPKSKSFFSRFVEGYTLVERDGEANNERFMGEISFWFGRQGRSSNDDSSQSEESMNQ